jgi:hypothetical protein
LNWHGKLSANHVVRKIRNDRKISRKHLSFYSKPPVQSKRAILQNKGRPQNRVTQQIYNHCETESVVVTCKTLSVGQTSSDSVWHTPSEMLKVTSGKVIPFAFALLQGVLDIGRRLLTLA